MRARKNGRRAAPRRVCVFFNSRSRGAEDVEGSLQWTPATALTTALKAPGSLAHKLDAQLHSRSVCSGMCAHRLMKEMQEHHQQQQQWHELELQRGSSTSYWRSLYFLHGGPGLATSSQCLWFVACFLRGDRVSSIQVEKRPEGGASQRRHALGAFPLDDPVSTKFYPPPPVPSARPGALLPYHPCRFPLNRCVPVLSARRSHNLSAVRVPTASRVCHTATR
jgi:hypothetical protein